MAVGRLLPSWTRREWTQVGVLIGVVAALHLIGFGALTGAGALSIGVGVAAYLLGMRHAFDADHIAAIDNVTRKLSAQRARPKSVGFWFALGHSAMVVVLALIVAGAARAAGELLDDGSPARRLLGTVGAVASGGFLYLIAAVNIVVLVGIWRAFAALRAGRLEDRHLDGMFEGGGVMARLLNPLMRRITTPAQMFVVGALFGLGFDTATEVALLSLAGSGAAAGVPWYGLLTLPVLFAAGMSLLDTLDGVFMSAAYDWAFVDPFRKIYYNLTVTALSVLVAVAVGSVQFVKVIHDDLGWANPFTDWVSSIGMDRVGFAVVGVFALTWVVAYSLRPRSLRPR